MKAYGGKCVCCGEQEVMFLTIDHIHNDGAEERKKLFGSNRAGKPYYQYLKVNGYPKGRLQVMCFNCNCSKVYNRGDCPHKQKQRSEFEASRV